MTKTKQCVKCGEIKSIDSFPKHSGTKDGVCSWCRSCHNKASNEYRYRTGKSSPAGDNKSCSDYLGVHIAERVLSHVFKDVTRMNKNNPGYDFMCRNGYKIDVKSAVHLSRRPNEWFFNIHKNKIADYFLLIAFNNRSDLDPEHVWLIPGNDVNDKDGVSISVNTLNKWYKYELHDKLDAVISCCDTLKGDEHDSSE